MKNVIIEEKAKKKEKLSKDIVDRIAPAEVTQALSFVDLTEKYI